MSHLTVSEKHLCTTLYFPATQLSQAVLTPDVALYFPASQLSQARFTPTFALYFPASQLVQTVAPAIYIHTLSHTTLCKF